MNKIIKNFIIIVGFLLLVNATVLSLITNFNFGLIITLVFGIGLILYGSYFERINLATKYGILKNIKHSIFFAIACMLCLITFIGVYGQIDNVTYKEDAVIVLGAGIKGETITMPLLYRLQKAVEYSNKNPNAIIVVSGGQGFQEDIPEALAMERYLIKMGAHKDKIIREDKATSTFENFNFSKSILDKFFNRPYRVVLITNSFHIYRATQISKIVGLDSTHYHAELDWYTIPVNYLRESLAIIKLWILRR